MIRPLTPSQKALKAYDKRALRRTLHFLEDKVGMFTKLVPWPALAASYQKDIDTLLNHLRSIDEPQDRQSPAQS